MRRNTGEAIFGEPSCGNSSDSDSEKEDALKFKRSKRLKTSLDCEYGEEVDFRKSSNGGSKTPDSIIRTSMDAHSDSSEGNQSNVRSKYMPKENGDVCILPGGIACRASATEIMKRMGFDKSVGLGRSMNEYELSPENLDEMEALLRKEGLVVTEDTLDFEKELSVEEEIRWIPPAFPHHSCDFAHLNKWRKVGARIFSMSSEDKFVDPSALRKVSVLRKCLNCLNEYEYQQLRSRTNPFEALGKGPFICRAGLKIANLDAVMSNALTQPTTSSTEKQAVLGPNDLFYFADVCAGPGGFSEYVLYRKKWNAKGFGMTLKGKLDFDRLSFLAGSPESFEPFYGPSDDGNVYDPANTSAFINYVVCSTEGRGVHLLMADGGFEVENKELTEVLSGQLYLSQCYLALALVRPGGVFVCKLFDTLTPFSIGLIYLMYLSFDLVGIHKPVSSRPANSERYLVCKWKKQDVDGITRYLKSCHDLYWKWTCYSNGESLNQDIIELVPMSVLKNNKGFMEYIIQMNTIIARQQASYLEKMILFARNPDLKDPRRESAKNKCIEFWRIPMSRNKTIPLASADKFYRNMLGSQTTDFVGCQEYQLTEHNLGVLFRSPYDWRVVVIEANPQERSRGFYLSLGGNRIYRYDGKSWVHITEKLELCKETLVYGEFVEEIYGKKPNQAIIKTFHIIDAMMLGGTDVRGLHYTTRHEVCVKFAKSMNKPSQVGFCHVRAKIPVRMENIADIFDRLENRVVAKSGPSAQLVCPVDHTDETLPFIKPAGVLFLKITKEPWTMALSRTSNRKYYFNLNTGDSKYDLVPDSVSSFEYTMQNRVIWWWDRDLKNTLATQDVTLCSDTQPINLPAGTLNPKTLLRFVGGEWQANRTSVMRRMSSSSSNHSSS